jgi:hypothetical protein
MGGCWCGTAAGARAWCPPPTCSWTSCTSRSFSPRLRLRRRRPPPSTSVRLRARPRARTGAAPLSTGASRARRTCWTTSSHPTAVGVCVCVGRGGAGFLMQFWLVGGQDIPVILPTCGCCATAKHAEGGFGRCVRLRRRRQRLRVEEAFMRVCLPLSPCARIRFTAHPFPPPHTPTRCSQPPAHALHARGAARQLRRVLRIPGWRRRRQQRRGGRRVWRRLAGHGGGAGLVHGGHCGLGWVGGCGRKGCLQGCLVAVQLRCSGLATSARSGLRFTGAAVNARRAPCWRLAAAAQGALVPSPPACPQTRCGPASRCGRTPCPAPPSSTARPPRARRPAAQRHASSRASGATPALPVPHTAQLQTPCALSVLGTDPFCLICKVLRPSCMLSPAPLHPQPRRAPPQPQQRVVPPPHAERHQQRGGGRRLRRPL